jgi:predicted glutamine amidotransferase
MCGIVGFITEEKNIGAIERKKFFINALRAGVVRGDDGTGIFMVPHDLDGPADWAKLGGPAEQFLQDKHAIARLGYNEKFDEYRAVIGHNRSATVGNTSTANAHPFQEGPITLVHNGTLNTMGGLPTPKHKAKGADVDSHVITHNLATASVEDVVKELDGAYALVWHDARDKSVNILRNSQRPLHLMLLKNHKTILLASEAEMLHWLVQRSSFTAGDAIFYPEPGYLLKFTDETGIKPRVTKLTMHTYRTYSGGGYGGYQGGAWRGHENEGWDGEDSYGTGETWYQRRDAAMHPPVNYIPREGSNMGKAPSPPVQAGPHICQKSLDRKIPKPLMNTLSELQLDKRDKLRMMVASVQQIPGTRNALVIGRLLDLVGTPTAQIYGLQYEAVQSAQGRETWTVAPNGVKEVGNGIKVVLVRLLSRSSISRLGARTAVPLNLNGQAAPSAESLVTSSPSSSTSEENPDNDAVGEDTLWEQLTDAEKQQWLENEVYYDADGNTINFKKFLDLTHRGCRECRETIDPVEAAEMVWDTETKEPICAECRWEMEDNGDLDVLTDDEEIDYSEAS